MTRVVVKLGGSVAVGGVRHALALRTAGCEVVVVHGAGPQISERLEERGLPVRFVDGRRFTDAETMVVVRGALVSLGAEVTAALGPTAVQLVGDEIGLSARSLPALGLVGQPLACAPPAIEDALGEGLIPVVTPVAVGPLNVNADEAAAALAEGLGAERVVFVTDVRGVLLEGSLVTRLAADRADALLEAGAFEGGIVPKLTAAVRAARAGVAAEIGETAMVA